MSTLPALLGALDEHIASQSPEHDPRVNTGPGAWVPDLEGRGPEGQACLLPLEVCFLQTLICGC